MRADLDVEMLFKIMERLGDFRARFPKTAQSTDLLDLLESAESEDQARKVLWRHVTFLEDAGYVKTYKAMGYSTVSAELTVQGEMFVQTELAEFGRQPMLPQVVTQIENRIEVSRQPAQEKVGLRYKLRESVASGAADLCAKVLVEIGSRIAGV